MAYIGELQDLNTETIPLHERGGSYRIEEYDRMTEIIKERDELIEVLQRRIEGFERITKALAIHCDLQAGEIVRLQDEKAGVTQ